MNDPSLSRQSNDIILKHVAGVLGDGLFRRFDIGQAPIARRLPAELPVLEVRTDYADLLYELTDDTIVDLELQSGSTPGDLERFADYSWSVWRRHRKRVHTVVLYGPRVTTAPPNRLDAGGHVFRLTNILLADQDGEAVLARLKAKRERQEPFADQDLVDLVLAPLMRQRRPLIEVVPELLPLVDALPPGGAGGDDGHYRRPSLSLLRSADSGELAGGTEDVERARGVDRSRDRQGSLGGS